MSLAISSLFPLQEPYATIVRNVEQESSPSVQYDCAEFQLRSLLLKCCEALGSQPEEPFPMQGQQFQDRDLETSGIKSIQDTFENCIQLCKHLKIDGIARLGLVLLEDIIETLPLNLLQRFYSNVKPLQVLSQLWSEDSDNLSGAHALQFIRVCNTLLRRLPPKSEWTGRILLELSHSLPLTDKSCWKPWGSVSPGQVTFDSSQEYQGDDYTFYETFWSLQQDFANPFQIPLPLFCSKYTRVLTQLESYASRKGSHIKKLDTATLPFLTHSRILTPQLESNQALKLHLLTQFAIVEAFLRTTQLPPSIQAALDTLSKRSQQLLETIDAKHANLLETLLQSSEVIWRNWKKTKCSPTAMQLVPWSESNPANTASSLSNQNQNPQDDFSELQFLAPISMTELAKISAAMRSGVPSVPTLLKDYVEALDPEAGIDEEYSPKRDKFLGWQALRLLSVDHLASFDQILPNGDFENLVRKVYHDAYGTLVPGEYLENVAKYDVDDEDEINVDASSAVVTANAEDAEVNDLEQSNKAMAEVEDAEDSAVKIELDNGDDNVSTILEGKVMETVEQLTSSTTAVMLDNAETIDGIESHTSEPMEDSKSLRKAPPCQEEEEPSNPIVDYDNQPKLPDVPKETIETQSGETVNHPTTNETQEEKLLVTKTKEDITKRGIRGKDQSTTKGSVSDGEGIEDNSKVSSTTDARSGQSSKSSGEVSMESLNNDDDEASQRRKLEDEARERLIEQRKRKRAHESNLEDRRSQPPVKVQRDSGRATEGRSGDARRGPSDVGHQRHGPSGHGGGNGGVASNNRSNTRGLPTSQSGRGPPQMPLAHQPGPRGQPPPLMEGDRGSYKHGRSNRDDRRGVSERRGDTVLHDDRRSGHVEDSRRGGRGNRDGNPNRRR